MITLHMRKKDQKQMLCHYKCQHLVSFLRWANLSGWSTAKASHPWKPTVTNLSPLDSKEDFTATYLDNNRCMYVFCNSQSSLTSCWYLGILKDFLALSLSRKMLTLELRSRSVATKILNKLLQLVWLQETFKTLFWYQR